MLLLSGTLNKTYNLNRFSLSLPTEDDIAGKEGGANTRFYATNPLGLLSDM